MAHVAKGKGECIVVKGWTVDGERGQTVGTCHTSLQSLWHPSEELGNNNLYARLW